MAHQLSHPSGNTPQRSLSVAQHRLHQHLTVNNCDLQGDLEGCMVHLRMFRHKTCPPATL